MSTSSPIAEPTLARRKAREIIDQNPGATMVEVVALAYLEGRIEGVNEVRKIARETLTVPAGLHEYDIVCQRCGRRAGSRFLLAQDAPPHGYIEGVCFHCTTADSPRAA